MAEATAVPAAAETATPANNQQTATPQGDGNQDLEALLEEKRARLSVLEGNFSQLDQQLDDEFATQYDDILTADEQELRYDNQADYIRLVLAKADAFKAERLGATEQEIAQLQSEIGSAESKRELAAARERFIAAHPEVSIDELNAFVNRGMTGEQRLQLQQLQTYDEAFDFAYQLYSAQNGTAGAQQPAPTGELPPSFDMGAGSAPNEIAPDPNADYLKKLGLA
ncbi:MAG: hypothetical protein LBN32_00340 [Helicobacteraceae bacterium]|nr:hypothetical protein [Helicobacteraceae bacterium]